MWVDCGSQVWWFGLVFDCFYGRFLVALDLVAFWVSLWVDAIQILVVHDFDALGRSGLFCGLLLIDLVLWVGVGLVGCLG